MTAVTLDHVLDDCRGVVVLRYTGAPSSERERVVSCLGCGAEHREPVSPRTPDAQVEDGGCDR